MLPKSLSLNEKRINASERKRRSDNETKYTCFYMYNLLLNLDPTIKITLNRNVKQGSQVDNCIKNFQCESIDSNNNQIFQHGNNYTILQDDESGMYSLVFDDITDTPKQVEEPSKISLTADQSCRLQQHIMMNKINKLLLYYFNMVITFHIRRQKAGTVSKLTLDSFVDIDENNQFIMKEKRSLNDDYHEICETINSILSYFIDNRVGITQQLIIGDNIPNEITTPQNECIYLSRYIYDQIFRRIRFNKENVDDVISSYANKYSNLQENENQTGELLTILATDVTNYYQGMNVNNLSDK